jgi:manganese transport system permease protein
MSDLLNWFVAPLQSPVMVKALWVSSFVGIVCAVLSCYITLKGWSLMGDAVSHAVVPGVVVAYALNIPFAVGAFIFGFGATVAIGYVKSKTRLKEDAVIGVVFTGFFAFGIILATKIPSNIDLFHILFGNVLAISQQDIIQTIIAGFLALIVILLLKYSINLLYFTIRISFYDRYGFANSGYCFSSSYVSYSWFDCLSINRSFRSHVNNF